MVARGEGRCQGEEAPGRCSQEEEPKAGREVWTQEGGLERQELEAGPWGGHHGQKGGGISHDSILRPPKSWTPAELCPLKSEMRHKLAEGSHLQGPEISGAEGSQGAETCTLSISLALAPAHWLLRRQMGVAAGDYRGCNLTPDEHQETELLALGVCRPGPSVGQRRTWDGVGVGELVADRRKWPHGPGYGNLPLFLLC